LSSKELRHRAGALNFSAHLQGFLSVGAVGLEPTLLLEDPDFKSGASTGSATPPCRLGVYQSGPGVLAGTAGVFGVGLFEALEGPLGYRVGDGAGEVEGGESVETLHVAAWFPDAGYAATVAGEMFGMDLLYSIFSHVFPGGPHAACGLQARDSPVEAGAGNPEARRHVAGPLVLDDARRAERATGGDAERSWLAPQLAGHGFEIFGGFRLQATGIRFYDLSAPALQRRSTLNAWRATEGSSH
jgi:hypothetical protein